MTPTASSSPIGGAPEARLVTPYAPRLLIQRLAERPEALVEDVDGTIVFVDISGFTRLSERLASKGKAGLIWSGVTSAWQVKTSVSPFICVFRPAGPGSSGSLLL